jgi:hypothetical protein
LDVTAIVADDGEIDFHLVNGSSGSKTIVFQLVSNHSDFLTFRYLAYGIKEEDYKKVTSVSLGP